MKRLMTLVLVVLAGFLTGCSEKLCERDAAIGFGDYAVINNQHGLAKLFDGETYTQCVFSFKGGFPLGWEWDCQTAAPGVKGFPQILYGWNPWRPGSTTRELPRYVGELSTLTANHSATVIAGGVYNVAFDLWFVRETTIRDTVQAVDPDGHEHNSPRMIRAPDVSPEGIVLELMVWTVAYMPVGGEKLGTFGGNDNPWQVYLMRSAGKPPLLMFVAGKHYTSGKTDLMPFVKYAMEAKLLAADSYLACVEYGTEMIHGKGRAVFSEYAVEIIGKVVAIDSTRGATSVDSIVFSGFPPTTAPAGPNPICKERGHVGTEGCEGTLMYCPPRTVDLPDKTLQIYEDRNVTTCICSRCGERYVVPHGGPDTVVVWQRSDWDTVFHNRKPPRAEGLRLEVNP